MEDYGHQHRLKGSVNKINEKGIIIFFLSRIVTTIEIWELYEDQFLENKRIW